MERAEFVCCHGNSNSWKRLCLGVSTTVIGAVEMASNGLVVSLAVSKAPFATYPQKEPYASPTSHETLMRFLRRRHSRYLAKLKKGKKPMRSRGCSGLCSRASNARGLPMEAKEAGKEDVSDSPIASFASSKSEG